MPPGGALPRPPAVGNMELIAAAQRGDVQTVRALLGAGADINGRDDQGRTAVLAATQSHRTEMVGLLTRAGADINQRDNRMDNPLLFAGAEGFLDIVLIMIAAGADTRIPNRFGGTALIPAAERGHVEVVEALLNRSDVNVNHVNNLGWTALLEAIILSDGGPRHQRIVSLLLMHGADPNLRDKDGVSPLTHARRRGYREIEQLLIAAGAR